MYNDDKQLIPRGTTVQVKRVPMPRGEKKTWRVERETNIKDVMVSNVEVTSTSEEGRMDQVCHLIQVTLVYVSNYFYSKDQKYCYTHNRRGNSEIQ